MKEKMLCSRCRKDIPDGMFVGIKIKLSSTKKYSSKIKKQLGKYKINTEYNFCYECWLDSLMGISK